MIPFATLKPALAAIATTLTDLQTSWENETLPAIAMPIGAHARLLFYSSQPIALTSDLTYARVDAPADMRLIETVTDLRTATFRIKAESIHQDPGYEAFTYLERARTRLGWSRVMEAFRAAGVGYQSTALMTDVSVPLADRGRIQSVAVLDLIVNVAGIEADPVPRDALDFVDTPVRVV